ncbi:MAG: hypothetical protein AB7C97_04495 [Oscillospiraceae bacterium]
MENFEKAYLLLFNEITDAIVEIERCNYGSAAEILKNAQIKAENIYIEEE